jgi:hypothetical protein
MGRNNKVDPTNLPDMVATLLAQYTQDRVSAAGRKGAREVRVDVVSRTPLEDGSGVLGWDHGVDLDQQTVNF